MHVWREASPNTPFSVATGYDVLFTFSFRQRAGEKRCRLLLLSLDDPPVSVCPSVFVCVIVTPRLKLPT
ncbi:hypothetical protein E2C01_092333 [Portunus trituberculatus]|uniref:Uncharacterized protein n=1 Tax=Portunus trituberculatus TaxID=210409 RepID=A0A5B7JR40_PORTR|nr:hypothetical protein [Portunus trituberculatus]